MVAVDAAGPAPRRRLVRGGPAVWLGAVLTLVMSVLIIVPIAIVILASFSHPELGFIGNFTLQNFGTLFSSPDAGPLLLNTLEFTAGASIIAIVVAAGLAWIVSSTNVPFPRLVRLLPLAPLLIPPLMRDTGWVQLYSPRTGLVNLLLEHALGLKSPPFNIFTMGGMIVDVGLNMVPIAYIVVLGAFQSINRSLDEASHISGAGTARTLRKIVLPLVLPAILSAFALTALVVAASFETPIVIGAPGGISTYMSEIYNSLSAGVPNYNLAAAQSDIYFVLNGLLLTWYLIATRREQRFQTVSGRGYSRAGSVKGTHPLRRAGLLAIPLVVFLLAFVQLFAQGVLVSLAPFYSTTQGFPFSHLTLANYVTLFQQPLTSEALANSLKVSVAATVLTAIIALLFSAVALQSKFRGRRLIELLGTLPIAIPPMVFSVALLITVLITPGLRQQYGGFLPLIIVDVVVCLPYAVRTTAASLVQISPELLEAGAIAGASPGRRLFSITLPLVRGAVANGALIVFVLSFRELAGVALLTGPDTPLVPTVALNLYFVGESPAVSALNIVTVVIPLLVVGIVLAIAAIVRSVLHRGQSWRRDGLEVHPAISHPLSSPRAVSGAPRTESRS